MNKEEIKETRSMRDVVSSYGIPINRAGLCSCPFHSGDRSPSMKLYKDNFHCYGCGADGDIFTFVQMYEGISFKSAFVQLGGHYEKMSKADKIEKYRREQERKKKLEHQQKINDEIRINNFMLHASRDLMKKCEPLSDDWCFYNEQYNNALIKDELLQEELQ